MKKGIALFSTLMILVLVIMLMSVSLKNSTNIKITTLQDRYLIQENLTVTDIVKLINEKIAPTFKPDKNTDSMIDIQKTLFAYPLMIEDSVTNSKIQVTMSSEDGKLNINLVNNNESEIKNYINRVFSKIGVQEPAMLSNMLLSNINKNIDGDDKYRDEYKLPLKYLDKSFGLINSYETFQDILYLYVKNTDDREALTIDFKKYFKFYVEYDSSNGNLMKYTSAEDCKLDINYAKIELIQALQILTNDTIKALKDYQIIYELTSNNYLEKNEENSFDMKKVVEDLKTNNINLKINISSINNKVEYIAKYNLKVQKISKISMGRWIY